MSTGQRKGQSDTRKRLLEATEWLFIESGYESMSLRQITTRARANLASVNYHFGSKDALMQQLLSQRLDRLNLDRLQLLDACEKKSVAGLDVTTLLGVLFVPAFRRSYNGNSGAAFMRLLGRVYSDPSPFIRNYLQQHYRPIFGRFFEAFSRALPALPRHELGLRLHFGLKAVSGILAGEDIQELIAGISKGEEIKDAELLSRLISLIAPILTASFDSPEQIQIIDRLLELDTLTAAHSESDEAARESFDSVGILHWLKQEVSAT